MVDIVTAAEVASLLGQDVSDGIALVVELANELVTEAWDEGEDPPTPIPARVRGVALNVALRAAGNPKGLSSWTTSWDDISRTERMDGARRLGLFITDEELADLNGEPETGGVGSIETPTRNQAACRTRWSC